MSGQELFHQNFVVKIAKNRCKSAQTSTKCWSISLKFGPKFTWHILNLIVQVLGLHLVYQWCYMCHMCSRNAKIQPQMAVSGSADIFSIKVDSRLKTILVHTVVATEMNFSSLFLHKYISSPKCRFRECSWRGIHAHSPGDPNPTKQGSWDIYIYYLLIFFKMTLLHT